MTQNTDIRDDELQKEVSDRYGKIAREVIDASGGSRSSDCCSSNPITRDLYTADETVDVPDAALQASLGCGNPTALIELSEGQVVLDLGSGGGIDVMLSAQRVGATGKAYGLDMTDDMLELARKNQREAGVENVEFLKGQIEDIPLPDASVDVIISNCVINLSSDKGQVLKEAFRVLRPGGRFAVSDVVVRGSIDPRIRSSVEAWIGCVAGALDEDEYRSLLAAAGFTDIEIVPTRIYDPADAGDVLANSGISIDELTSMEGQFISAFVRASKAG